MRYHANKKEGIIAILCAIFALCLIGCTTYPNINFTPCQKKAFYDYAYYKDKGYDVKCIRYKGNGPHMFVVAFDEKGNVYCRDKYVEIKRHVLGTKSIYVGHNQSIYSIDE